MKKIYLTISIIIMTGATIQSQNNFDQYPQTKISNKHVTMLLHLPDPEKGSYRGTRFDWSGVIYSLQYKGHEYFGYWKDTHDPLVHEDLSGPVESYITAGLGFEEAKAGGKFIRIGVGVLEKPDDKPYQWDHTYKILDHGEWLVNQGKDWIEFQHILNSDIGYGYVYTKRIELKSDEPGFTISHLLKNTGSKHIETDQFNHNFLIIDGEKSGPNIRLKYPYEISTDADLKGYMEIDKDELYFVKPMVNDNVWMEFQGYSSDVKDHKITVENTKTKTGVVITVDKPIYRMVFWACEITYSPENFIMIKVDPGKEDKWVSDYSLFIR